MGSAEVQGDLWSRDPQTWAGLQEPQMRPIYDATLDALEPLADTALLDAGCGSGLMVALAAGRGAVVSGLDASAPLAVSDHGVVENLLDKAGLTLAGGGEAPVSFSYTSHAQAWTAHTSAGPLQKVIDIAGPDAVRQAVYDVLEADRKPDGQLRQDNVFRYVLATKP